MTETPEKGSPGMSVKHSLTAKDKTALTADCSVCGPGVEIRKQGRYGFVCLVARREARRNWRKAHPDRSRRSRNYATSGHSLEKRDGGTDMCSKCGVVEVAAWGRGWICANLLAEKGWTSKQAKPEPKCSRCNSAWPINGRCPECDPDPEYIQKRTVDWFEQHLATSGLQTQLTESSLLTGYESAVPGWKTIGDRDGATVREAYIAAYGTGDPARREEFRAMKATEAKARQEAIRNATPEPIPLEAREVVCGTCWLVHRRGVCDRA